MTIREALAEGREALAGHETETPSLDAALLLAHARRVSRERLYMELSDAVDETSLAAFRVAMERRRAGEPVAWIIGRKEFFGLEFTVGPGVLCPRPDSEILIEEALGIMDGMTSAGAAGSKPDGLLHDCCCGPGTLALALAHERPRWRISASDISPEAERYFRANNETLTAGEVTYKKADLMEGVDGPFDIIVSNPPYLTPAETDERTALSWREPVLALDGGGSDGLDVIRRLVPRMADRLKSGGAALIEADPLQMPIIGEILVDTGFRQVRVRSDLGGRDRVIIARYGGGT